MDTKSIPWWVWLIPIVLLLVGMARIPDGYHTFLRIAICGFAGFFIYVGHNKDPVEQAVSLVFLLIAVLFNPLIPIHVATEDWFILNVAAAGVFAAHLVFYRLRP